MSHKRQVYKATELKSLCDDENSCVSVVPTKRCLSLPPFFLNDMKSGIFYFLNSILKKYDRGLDGILLGYRNVKVLFDENTGIIQMGKAETEVNVSVEFYIFQPKIGSYLEGVVNKKSNNHIGCLVHKHFNATILKPEDVEYEDWICKDFNANDKITFKVKDLDFTRFLPYIEGIVDEDLIQKCQINRKANINFRNNLEPSTSSMEIDQQEVNTEESSFMYNCDEEKLDEIDSSVKKKKKKKKERKEKEKRKKNSEVESENEVFGKTEELNKVSSAMTLKNNEKEEFRSEHNKTDIKVKKKKKKDKKERESVTPDLKGAKVNESSVQKYDETIVFYSTQLEPSSTCKKLEMSFCSPIPQETTSTKKKKQKEKNKEKDFLKTIVGTSEVNNYLDKEELYKEKDIILKKMEKKKRKESTQSEEEKSSQKDKNEIYGFSTKFPSETSPKKKSKLENESCDKNNSKNIENEEFKVNESKKGNDVSTTFSPDLLSKKKSKLKNKSLTEKHSSREIEKEIMVEKIKCKMNEINSTNINEEVSTKFLLEPSPKKKSNLENKSVKEGHKKSSKEIEKPESQVQSLLDELLQNQINKVNEEWETPKRRSSESDRKAKSDTKAHKKKSKEKKKSPRVEDKNNEKSDASDSLYEKLLKQAKSAMNVTQGPSESDNKKNVLEKTPVKNIENKDKEKSLKVEYLTEKKSKKRKREDSEVEDTISKKFKNGSMYDFSENTPEKSSREDKSLFSDSETNSPEKNVIKLNGHISESDKEAEKPKVKGLLNDLVNEEKKRLKRDSEIPRGEEEVKKKKSSKSDKKKGKPKENTNKEEESLYEKLLKDAKCLINSSKEEVPKIKKMRTIDSYFKAV